MAVEKKDSAGGSAARRFDPIRFLDMRERNDAERDRMRLRIRELEALGGTTASPAGPAVSNGRGSVRTPEEDQELQNLRLHVDDQVVDPVFLAVTRDLVPPGDAGDPTPPIGISGSEQESLLLHKDGLLPSQQGAHPSLSAITADEKAVAAVFGILARDNQVNTKLKRRFAHAISVARGEYNADIALYEDVLGHLVIGVGDQPGRTNDDVEARDWASVVKTLQEQGAQAGELYTRIQTLSALSNLRAADDGQPPSSIAIDLPDLEEEVDVEIVVDNLQAMQALYFSAMLEEVKLFQVTDKLVEQFNQGVLPLGKGKAGDLLFEYWRRSTDRFTETERLNLYARAFGFPVGEPGASGTPNREFEAHWMHFTSAVSSFFRQLTLDDLLSSRIPAPVSQEQVRKAGRDLAANLSLYGYGVAYFAATDLQAQIRKIIELLSTDEVKNAYGARDLWQVVDQVGVLELGGGRSTVRYRTMATAGATIIRWLSLHPGELASVGRPVIDGAAVRKGTKSPKPMVSPTDRDLVDACEQWLAVTGTPDVQVEQYAQPVETPNSTSRPVQIPAIARDMLESVGIGAGVTS